MLSKILNMILFLEDKIFNFAIFENISLKCKTYLYDKISKITILHSWFEVYSILTKIMNIKEKINNEKNSSFLNKIKTIFGESELTNIALCQNDELDEDLDTDIKSVRKSILKRMKNVKVKKIILMSKSNNHVLTE
jgi:hypothetical protein